MLAGKPTDRPFAAWAISGRTIALRAARIAGGGQPRDALRARLLGDGPVPDPVISFAAAEAEAENGRHVVIHRELRRIENIQAIDVHDLRAGSHGIGPFDVEVRFHDVAVIAGIVAHQNLYGIVVRQIELLPETAYVG